ncbi:MAG: hypothetical protein JST63_09230 [Bacteroidetes bacterium]|nr:hypothetical protein [Bacteroidota bacterium]
MLTTQKKSLKAGKYVSTNYVDNIIRTYKQERWVHNSARIGKEDSLSSWYSIEELEEFIEKAKVHGADGIKFYFAAYPSDFTEKPEYAGRQTLALVATKSKEQEIGIAHKDLYIQDGESINILAYNAGRLCPPSCPPPKGGDADDWGGVGVTIVDKGPDGMIII